MESAFSVLEYCLSIKDESVSGERIKEIVDFVTTESPYRSANKGWVTENIYLQWGRNNERSGKKFDQLVEVNVYWKPIIQIVSIIFVVIGFATILGFLPIFITEGSFGSNVRSIDPMIQSNPTEQKIDVKEPKMMNIEPIQKVIPAEQKIDVKEPKIMNTESVQQLNSTDQNIDETATNLTGNRDSNTQATNNSKSVRRVVTADDLFLKK